MAIDTDDLSEETYNAIIFEAERFDSNLALPFGLISYECDDETTFIKNSKSLIQEMLTYDEVDLDDLFFGAPPAMKAFHTILKKILSNIAKLEQ